MEETERMVSAIPNENYVHTHTHQQQEDDDQDIKQDIQEIWSWGAGTEGQLCTGILQDQLSPQLVSNTLSSFGSISLLSCGGAHVLARTSGGKVLSWGRGASGQLGQGEIVPNCLYLKLVDSLSSFNICHLSAGWNHSGFVSDSGCLFTCGDGSFGQLGHGDYQSCSSPVEVSFFSFKHVEQVACGMRHTLVLTKGSVGDQVYGFGSGKRGQLGVSKDKVRSLSAPQPCLGFDGHEVMTITANGDHSAALSADGHLYTWGRGFNGGADVCVPVSLPSSSSYTQAALGWNHALLLTDEGEVFILGGSHHGVLSETQRAAHVHNLLDSGKPLLSKVSGLDGKKVLQIAAGAEHSSAVTENGDLYTWGWGEHGQLGLGNTSDQIFPLLVELLNGGTSLASRVYCGSGFTFVLKTRPAM